METTLQMLRAQHRTFCYRSYEYHREGDVLVISFHFVLDPDIEFKPEIRIPWGQGCPKEFLDTLVFHLGLVEMISYWKCACAPRLLIEAGALSEAQCVWWKDLLIHGLGEFFFQNKIDFSSPDFVILESSGPRHNRGIVAHAEGDLVLVGGGKDSSLTLELLSRRKGVRRAAFSLNPTRSSRDSALLAGYSDFLSADRMIDPKLLALNKKGYLNGHTPFSAYLAFLGTFVGALHGFSNIITSNERSADEQNAEFHGMAINHQYSKSFRFEKLFQEYAAQFLTKEVYYFSFLRPLHDLQVSALFSQHPVQLLNFRSCNVHQKKDSWCGRCPKCAFVYLSLFPFIAKDLRLKIFGSDLFHSGEIVTHIHDLLGKGAHKPFECVGSVEESLAAFCMSLDRIRRERDAVPAPLAALEKELSPHERKLGDSSPLLGEWGRNHALPPEFELILKNEIRACISNPGT